jgi:hypothetical protein
VTDPVETRPGDRVWSINDTRDLLGGVSRSAVYDLVRSGHLVARKLGSRTVQLQSDLEAFLASLPAITPDLGARSSCAAQSCDSEPDLGERAQP